jgi:uncharacterized protein (DUF924 family)
MDETALIATVLAFWFAPETEPRWFDSTPEFDREIEAKFGVLHDRALAGEFDGWTATADGTLALLVLLDQFPRNMFRGTPRAFESDVKAREISRMAIEKDFDQMRPPRERPFFYLPLTHSENLDDQEECVRLHERLQYEDYLDFAVQHRDIIARFGRFPHRNKILARESSAEEQEFLRTHEGF